MMNSRRKWRDAEVASLILIEKNGGRTRNTSVSIAVVVFKPVIGASPNEV
jgi:hypothetical protein